MQLEGERIEGGEEQDGTIFHWSPLAIAKANARDKISDMKLNTGKQLILSIFVMEIYLDI